MIKTVIIFGGHIQALGLARQSNALGVKVILFLNDMYSITRFSNSVNETVICKTFDEIDKKLAKYQTKQTLLLPTSDDYIDYIYNHYEYLSQKFTLGIPSKECINIFSDKRNAYNFIKHSGVEQPQSWCPNTIDDIKVISKQISYPIVVKPAIMYSFHKLFGKKAYLFHDSQEMVEKCQHISRSFPIEHLLIQEFMPGGAKTLYSYGVFSYNGEPQAWLIANRIRQNPMDFGNSTTFAITCDIPEIEQSAKKILRLTNYTGLAEIEFMYDSDTKVYKFLEINTRAWKWHTISNGLNFGFLPEMIHKLNGEMGNFTSSHKEVAWVERLTDFSVLIKEFFKGHITIKSIINNYRLSKTNAVWALKDIKPAIMYLLMAPVLYFKRH